MHAQHFSEERSQGPARPLAATRRALVARVGEAQRKGAGSRPDSTMWLGRGPADDLDSGPQERPRHTGHRETGPPCLVGARRGSLRRTRRDPPEPQMPGRISQETGIARQGPLARETQQDGASLRRKHNKKYGARLRGKHKKNGASLRGKHKKNGARLRGKHKKNGASLRGKHKKNGARLRGKHKKNGARLRGKHKKNGARLRGPRRGFKSGQSKTRT